MVEDDSDDEVNDDDDSSNTDYFYVCVCIGRLISGVDLIPQAHITRHCMYYVYSPLH